MSTQNKHEDDTLARDLLFGAAAIAKYIGRNQRYVYHQQKNLRLTHIGGQLVASKAKLKKVLAGEVTP